MARPAGFEPTTPWFVDCEPDSGNHIFNYLGATVRCPIAQQSTTKPNRSGRIRGKHSRRGSLIAGVQEHPLPDIEPFN